MSPVSRRFVLTGAALTTASLLVPITVRAGRAAESYEITDWIVIAPSGEVTLALSQPEVGQGSYTALPQILADELDADWERIKIRFVTGKAAYKIAFRQEPPAQKEGASMSTTALYERLRTAGAAAREVLTRAAAQRWTIDVAQCRTENGFVIHARGERLSYGELAAAAAKLPLSTASRTAANFISSASRWRAWIRRPNATAARSSASTSWSPACSTPPSRARARSAGR